MIDDGSELLDLHDFPNEALLARVYRDLYQPNFSLPEEREDLDQYRTRLFGPAAPPPQPQTHFVVCGRGLHDAAACELHGFVIFEHYRQSGCGLVTFLAVAPDQRGQGVGRRLMAQARQTLAQSPNDLGDRDLQAIFAEAHDPARVDLAHEPIDPVARLRILSRLGAQVVPFRYVQPELRPGAGPSRNLLFLAFPLGAEAGACTVPSSALRAFLFEFHQALGVAEPFQDADFVAMLASIEASVHGAAPMAPAGMLCASLTPCSRLQNTGAREDLQCPNPQERNCR